MEEHKTMPTNTPKQERDPSGKGSNTALCSANLILDQGMIRMKNNAPSGDYMRKWQIKYGISDGTPIRIMTAEQYDELRSLASMAGIA